MEKRNKYILLAFVGISCFSLLFLFFSNSILLHNLQSSIIQIEDERAVKQYSVDNITLFIDYSGVKTNEKFENVSLTNNNCCTITIQDYGWGIYIQEINGVGPGWIYTVNNGAPPSMPSDYFNLLNNDTVTWKHV